MSEKLGRKTGEVEDFRCARPSAFTAVLEYRKKRKKKSSFAANHLPPVVPRVACHVGGTCTYTQYEGRNNDVRRLVEPNC